MARKQDVKDAVNAALNDVKYGIRWFGDNASVAVRWTDSVEPLFDVTIGRRSVDVVMTWKQQGSWHIKRFTPQDGTNTLILEAVDTAVEQFRTNDQRWPVKFRLSPSVAR